MDRRLERTLRPASIAVIGGGAWCENVISQCRKIGYTGKLFSLHPTRRKIAGIICHARVADLPQAPDAAFVGVNRHASIDIVAQLAAIGTRGAVCFASGFKEAEREDAQGPALQDRLLRAAGDMTLIGPNCYGFVNYLDGALLWPDEHGGRRVDRGVAIITQSSNIAINITMQKRGLPIAYVVTVGNQAQTGLSQVGLALLRDDRVTALGLHIEGIDDLRRFEQLARYAKQCGKPIVCLKVGRSGLAQAATVSHTASLAGSHAGAGALFQRLSIAQVSSLPELLEALKIVHTIGGLSSGKIACLSCSGGEASLVADSAIGCAVEFVEPDEQKTTALRALLGPLVTIANPLDYHTFIWGDNEKMTAVFALMAQAPTALCLVILDIPRRDRCNADDWLAVTNCLLAARDRSGGNIAMLASLAENLPESLAEELMGRKIVPLCGIDEALAAISALAKISGIDTIPQNVLHAPLPATTDLVEEFEAKQILSRAGIRIPAPAHLCARDDVVVKAAGIGFPVVVKATGLAHKTEAGGVAVNLQTADEVAQAVAAMPGERFLVEPMAVGKVAELLIGIVLDSAHGYVLTLAAGGVASEMMNDSVSLMVPAERGDVEKALRSCRIGNILAGYRGQPGANLAAIIDTAMALQSYVADWAGKVVEIEINPLICTRTGAIAVDALIKKGNSHD